jgi:transposase
MKCSCGANVDRDLNGARGIYIKNFTLYEFHGR